MKKIVLSCIMLSMSACAANAASTAGLVEKGNRLYKDQDYTRALEKYEEALGNSPDSALISYNSGAALYKEGRYEQAGGYFEKALATDDKILEAKANYNLGNSRFMFGVSLEEDDPGGAVRSLEGALNNYERTLEITPDDQDAEINRKITEEKLKELREKLKQQPQQQKQRQKDKKKQDRQKKEQEQENRKEQQQEQQDQQDQQEQQEQQDQQDQQDQQEEKEEQDKQKQDQRQKEQERQAPAQAQGSEEMSPEEANMLLEGYRGQELPAGALKDRGKGKEQDVLKDW